MISIDMLIVYRYMIRRGLIGVRGCDLMNRRIPRGTMTDEREGEREF